MVMASRRRRAGGRASALTLLLASAIALGNCWCSLRPPMFVQVLRHPWSHSRLGTPAHMAQRSRVAQAASSVSVPGEVVPLGNHLLIKSKEASDASTGGILLTKKEKPKEGEVMAVGAGEPDEITGAVVPVSVEPGSNVLYSRYGGVDLDCAGVEHALVRDDDVLLSYSGNEPTLENSKVPRGRVLVQVPKAQGESAGGLLLAKGAAKDAMRLGEVVLVGEGELLKDGSSKPTEVAKGEMVKFRYGVEVKLADPDGDGMDHMLIRDDDILLTYNGEEPTLETTKMPRGRVLVRLQGAQEASTGGLLLSKGAANDAVGVGEVMLVGDAEVLGDGSTKPAEVEEGDMVRFRFGDEVKLDIGDGKFSSVKASNCIAKWKAA
mmetsp:Transcript_43194/g.78572  ORF Transcript_43194/g.78572 Transcript_43194/m.78572 type:complete len:378 (+) Transcript_43194:59-1192(+)